MELYRRSQFGRFLALLFLTGLLLSLTAALRPGERAPGNALLALALLAGCFVFTFMQVRVTDEDLEIRFGLGFPRKRVPLETILQVDQTRIPWHSVGIKRIRHGWAWSVSTGPALDLALLDGKMVRIGTADPEGLREALEKGTRKKLTS